MKEIKQLVEDYKMGFLTSQEFIFSVQNILKLFGAHKVIETKVNNLLADFAANLCALIEDGNLGNEYIEDL